MSFKIKRPCRKQLKLNRKKLASLKKTIGITPIFLKYI